MPYEPTLESLNTHPVPDWFADGKFGIFIHWGLFAVPAFASGTGNISEAFARDYWHAIANTPYTEWYANAIKVEGSGSAENQRAFWAGMPYEDFRSYFEEGLKQWRPQDWAGLFAEAGARYVVLVTKHHDGYCLWPSDVRNPNQAGWTSTRDIVGELAAAVRERGMKFGVYYSGGIDWTFDTRPLKTLGDFLAAVPGAPYPAYADAQLRELIERYKPSVLWNDISWPDGLQTQLALFADYYNAVDDGVVNDRWMPVSKASRRLKNPIWRFLFDLAAWITVKIRGVPDGVTPPVPPHCDFRTPEYTAFKTIMEKKWESTRGMSHSFGFNRMDTDKSYDPAEKLIADFVDAVSKNGNVLLNVGPRGLDAQIPDEQVARLKAFGRWAEANGEGIFGTRPWRTAEGNATFGAKTIPLRFTAQHPDALYAFFLGEPVPGARCTLRPDAGTDFPPIARVTALAGGGEIAFAQDPDGITLTVPPGLVGPAPGLRLHLAGG